MKEKRSLFKMIFGNKTQNTIHDNTLKLLSGFNATYTNISDNVEDNIIANQCIHTIATHCAKMMPRHYQSKRRCKKSYARSNKLYY